MPEDEHGRHALPPQAHKGRKPGSKPTYLATPGPGAGHDIDRAVRRKPHSHGFGGPHASMKRTDVRKLVQPGLPKAPTVSSQDNPGPGAYNNESALPASFQKSKEIIFDKSNRDQIHFIAQPGLPHTVTKSTLANPGPDYNVNRSAVVRNATKSSFGGSMAKMQRADALKFCQPGLPSGAGAMRPTSYPGPGQYNHHQKDAPQSKKDMKTAKKWKSNLEVMSQNRTTPAARIGTMRRIDATIMTQPNLPDQTTRSVMRNPGPGQYNSHEGGAQGSSFGRAKMILSKSAPVMRFTSRPKQEVMVTPDGFVIHRSLHKDPEYSPLPKSSKKGKKKKKKKGKEGDVGGAGEERQVRLSSEDVDIAKSYSHSHAKAPACKFGTSKRFVEEAVGISSPGLPDAMSSRRREGPSSAQYSPIRSSHTPAASFGGNMGKMTREHGRMVLAVGTPKGSGALHPHGTGWMPGPGTYNPATESISERTGSSSHGYGGGYGSGSGRGGVQRTSSMGASTREDAKILCQPGLPTGDSKLHRLNPGPGSYGDGGGKLLSTVKQDPASSFGGRLNQAQRSSGAQHTTTDVPGPGAYNTTNQLPMSRSRSRPRTSPAKAKQQEQNQQQGFLQGQQQQQQQQQQNKKSGKTDSGSSSQKRGSRNWRLRVSEVINSGSMIELTASSTLRKAPGWSIGSMTRAQGNNIVQPFLPTANRITKSMQSFPGPGSYETHSGIRSQINSSKKSAAQFKFAQSKQRPDLHSTTAADANLQEQVSSMAAQSNSTRKSAPSFGFGTSSRPHPAEIR